MRGQCTYGAHGQKMLRSRTFPSHIRPGVPRIFLTAPLSHTTVGLPHGQGEKLLRYGKLATSSYNALEYLILKPTSPARADRRVHGESTGDHRISRRIAHRGSGDG